MNVIVASEGLVYIEPHLDKIWHLKNYSELSKNAQYKLPSLGQVYIEDIKILFRY